MSTLEVLQRLCSSFSWLDVSLRRQLIPREEIAFVAVRELDVEFLLRPLTPDEDKVEFLDQHGNNLVWSTNSQLRVVDVIRKRGKLDDHRAATKCALLTESRNGEWKVTILVLDEKASMVALVEEAERQLADALRQVTTQ